MKHQIGVVLLSCVMSTFTAQRVYLHKRTIIRICISICGSVGNWRRL